jgi:radical SAM protein with 4Fe4S-binding SPASM domain
MILAVKLEEARRRLPVVSQLPKPKGRRGLLETPDGEVPVPKLAVWEITLACDQACLHCGPRAARAREDELDTDECFRVIDDLAEAGVGEVVLIGGEAYLRNDFILLIRRIRERGMSCTMTTGGYNLTPARAEAMVEAGVRSVSVSIDGLEASHDHVRNRPESWKRAFAALRNIRAAGGRISANSQINSLTRNELRPLLELLAPEGIHSWQIQLTVAHGAAADHPELLVQPYHLPEIFDELSLLAERCLQLGIRLFPANSIGYFGPYERKLRAFMNDRKHWVGCPAGRGVLGIESNGMLKSCPTLGGPTNIGGSWREHGFRALWERSPEIAYTRRRTIDDLWGYCRECYYADTCRAGCTAATEPLLGRPGNNPFCHHRALEMARVGHRERIEPVLPAFGVPFDNGLFRLIREHADPELRARHGPIAIDEPRVSRLVEPLGPGKPAVE